MWPRQFEIIHKIISLRLAESGEKYTHARAAALLGLSASTYQRIREGQRPSADDLEKICLCLGLNPTWALYGADEPLANAVPGQFNPDFVRICDTLHDVVMGHYPDKFDEFALVGGITPQQLNACVSSQMLPSASAIARWVHGYKLNANFLIAHIGQPYLSDEQYRETGPATWVRDIERQELELDLEENLPLADPIVQRVDSIVQVMREAGVDDMKILGAARDVLEGEMAKLARERGAYGAAESTAGMSKAAEDPAQYSDPRKAAGDDTV